MWFRAIKTVVFCLVIGFPKAYAQERPLPHANRPLFTYFNQPQVFEEDDGFSLKSTDAITKDDQGFLWVGGQGGLLRFDGSTFTRIPLCIEGNEIKWVRHLWFDRLRQKLWIATWGYGLLQLDLQTYNCLQVSTGRGHSDRYMYWLHAESDALWIGTPKGLSALYFQDNTVLHFTYTPAARSDDPMKAERSNKFYSFHRDRTNDSLIWLGSIYGLLRFNRISHHFEHYVYEAIPDKVHMKTNSIRTIFPLPGGDLLLGSWGGGVVRFSPADQSFSRIGKESKIKAFDNILNISPSSPHKLWVTSKGGVQELDLSTGELGESLKNDLTEQKIYGCQYQDEAGRIYIGAGGLFAMYDPLLQQFTQYSLPSDLAVDPVVEVKSIIKQPGQDVLWLAVYGGSGMYRYDETTGEWSVLPVGGNTEPESFYPVKTKRFQNGEHLILTSSSDYYRFNPAQQLLTPFSLEKKENLVVSDILEHSDGSHWFTTRNHGLIVQKEDKRRQYISELISPLKKGHPYSLSDITKDSLGNVWISSITGYSVYDYRQDTFYNFPYVLQDSVTPVDLSGILRDATGQIWLVTYLYGLMRVSPEYPDRGVNYVFNQTYGKNIRGAGIDHRGQMWLKTDVGLERFDPQLMECHLIENSYGISTRDVNLGNLADGRMYLGYQGGFTLFTPDSLWLNTTLPVPYVSDFAIFDKPLSNSASLYSSKELRLAPKDNFFSISFSAIHFSLSRQDSFAYKLEGVDPDWVYTQDRRRVFYTNVPSGHYTFRVKAGNNEGYWSPEIVALDIHIATPWWKTAWAITAYLLLTLLLLYGFYRFQLSRKLALAESERLREMQAWRSDVYANITHEFRTPLTVIMGMADTVQDHIAGGKSSTALLALDRIKGNGKRLLKLVNEMLDLAKLEHNSLDLNIEQLDAIALVKYLCENFRPMARSKQIDFKVHSSVSSLYMDLDQEKLSVVVSNLLSNAMKFTPSYGQVSVTLQRVKEGGASFFQLDVDDTGPGLSESDREAIFERFYQTSTGEKSGYNGSGLGLPLSRELLTLMEGSITVSSQPGRGSSFQVRLPINRQAPFAVSPARKDGIEISAPEPASNFSDEQATVLIVEDNEDVAAYIRSCLSGRYAVLYAADGEKGIAVALHHIPDLIISDLMMPGMDGLDLCSHLKNDERTNHIPIVLLTARATQADKITGIRHGADAYLTKPFAKEELLARLDQLLALRATLQQKYSADLMGEAAGRNDEKPLDPFVLKARQFVLEHLAEETFSGPELAEELCLSESQIYRKIKALTGMSTAIFIRYIRLERAKVLLQNDTLQIAEVAYGTGFKSPAYFSQVFKDTFGQSPSAFRNMARK